MPFMSRVKQELRGRAPSALNAAVSAARKDQATRDKPGPGAGQAALSAFREVERLRKSNMSSSQGVSRLKGPMGEVKERFRSRLHRRLFDS